MKRIFWTVIAILILFSIVAISYRAISNGSAAPTATATTGPLSFYCQEGVVSAAFSDGSAVVTLPNGQPMTLSQVVSADGGKYEATISGADLVFWTKGEAAFMTRNGAALYSNCITGTERALGAGMTAFTDATRTFSFTFPSDLILSGGDGTYSTGWSAGASTSGMLLARVSTPQDYMPKTNLGDVRFQIGESRDPGAVSSCLTETGLDQPIPPVAVTINGVKFAKTNSGDAGAGQHYETTAHKTVKNGQCYSVEYTIHSANIQNYPADLGIKPYDRARIASTFDSIINSFRFLQ